MDKAVAEEKEKRDSEYQHRITIQKKLHLPLKTFLPKNNVNFIYPKSSLLKTKGKKRKEIFFV